MMHTRFIGSQHCTHISHPVQPGYCLVPAHYPHPARSSHPAHILLACLAMLHCGPLLPCCTAQPCHPASCLLEPAAVDDARLEEDGPAGKVNNTRDSGEVRSGSKAGSCAFRSAVLTGRCQQPTSAVAGILVGMLPFLIHAAVCQCRITVIHYTGVQHGHSLA